MIRRLWNWLLGKPVVKMCGTCASWVPSVGGGGDGIGTEGRCALGVTRGSHHCSHCPPCAEWQKGES